MPDVRARAELGGDVIGRADERLDPGIDVGELRGVEVRRAARNVHVGAGRE